MSEVSSNMSSYWEEVADAPCPMTARQFHDWPKEPGYKYELHAGRVVRHRRTPEEVAILRKLGAALGAYAQQHESGAVIVNAPRATNE